MKGWDKYSIFFSWFISEQRDSNEILIWHANKLLCISNSWLFIAFFSFSTFILALNISKICFSDHAAIKYGLMHLFCCCTIIWKTNPYYVKTLSASAFSWWSKNPWMIESAEKRMFWGHLLTSMSFFSLPRRMSVRKREWLKATETLRKLCIKHSVSTTEFSSSFAFHHFI